MNIKSTSLDNQLPVGTGVGPKETVGEFAGLPNFTLTNPSVAASEPLPALQIFDGHWIADTDGDLVLRSRIVAVRIERIDGRCRVVADIDLPRRPFTFATFLTQEAAEKFRLALAQAVSSPMTSSLPDGAPN